MRTVCAPLMANVHAFDEHLTRDARGRERRNGRTTAARVRRPISGITRRIGPSTTRIRIGGNVQQAKLLVKMHPIIRRRPRRSASKDWCGSRPSSARTARSRISSCSSGDPTLAAAALDAVRQWQYQTTLLNGDPVEVMTEIEVNFTLAISGAGLQSAAGLARLRASAQAGDAGRRTESCPTSPLINRAALHHERDLLQYADILQRIARHRDDIGQIAAALARRSGPASPSSFAPFNVPACNAASGVMPYFTISTNSRACVPCGNGPTSEPIAIGTPAASCVRNSRA